MTWNSNLTFLPTYSMEKSPSWQVNWFSASQENPAFCGIRKFFTAFTIVRHLSLFWVRSIQSMTASHVLKIHFNIIFTSTSGFSKWPLYVRFHHQNLVCTIPLRFTRYMPRPSHSRFDEPSNIWRGVRIIKLLIMRFSPLRCYIGPLRPKDSPKHPIFKHP
jgi:hypothetical protein